MILPKLVLSLELKHFNHFVRHTSFNWFWKCYQPCFVPILVQNSDKTFFFYHLGKIVSHSVIKRITLHYIFCFVPYQIDLDHQKILKDFFAESTIHDSFTASHPGCLLKQHRRLWASHYHHHVWLSVLWTFFFNSVCFTSDMTWQTPFRLFPMSLISSQTSIFLELPNFILF